MNRVWDQVRNQTVIQAGRDIKDQFRDHTWRYVLYSITDQWGQQLVTKMVSQVFDQVKDELNGSS